MKTSALNRLEALRSRRTPPQDLVALEEQMLAVIEDQISDLKRRMKEFVQGDSALKKEVALVKSIKGVGEDTAILLVAVLEGGKKFSSAREAAAYFGLSVAHNQSGKSHGRSRLSKQGSTDLRKALYWPAVTAMRFNPVIRHQYQRLMEREKAKMVAVGAAMRKLVHLAYGVLKNKTEFNPVMS